MLCPHGISLSGARLRSASGRGGVVVDIVDYHVAKFRLFVKGHAKELYLLSSLG
jgi:hypothetical protein